MKNTEIGDYTLIDELDVVKQQMNNLTLQLHRLIDDDSYDFCDEFMKDDTENAMKKNTNLNYDESEMNEKEDVLEGEDVLNEIPLNEIKYRVKEVNLDNEQVVDFDKATDNGREEKIDYSEVEESLDNSEGQLTSENSHKEDGDLNREEVQERRDIFGTVKHQLEHQNSSSNSEEICHDDESSCEGKAYRIISEEKDVSPSDAYSFISLHASFGSFFNFFFVIGVYVFVAIYINSAIIITPSVRGNRRMNQLRLEYVEKTGLEEYSGCFVRFSDGNTTSNNACDAKSTSLTLSYLSQTNTFDIQSTFMCSCFSSGDEPIDVE